MQEVHDIQNFHSPGFVVMDGAGILVPSSEDESNAPGTAYADLRVVQVIDRNRPV